MLLGNSHVHHQPLHRGRVEQRHLRRRRVADREDADVRVRVGQLRLVAEVHEDHVSALGVGSSASAMPLSRPGLLLEGVITAVGAEVRPVTRSVVVEAERTDADGDIVVSLYNYNAYGRTAEDVCCSAMPTPVFDLGVRLRRYTRHAVCTTVHAYAAMLHSTPRITTGINVSVMIS